MYAYVVCIYCINIYIYYVLCGCNVWYSMHIYAYMYVMYVWPTKAQLCMHTVMMHRIFFNLYDYILCILLHM